MNANPDAEPRIRYDWARVECPTCGALPDTRCRAKSGRTTDAHVKRIMKDRRQVQAREEYARYGCRCSQPWTGIAPAYGLSAYAIRSGGTDHPRDPSDLCRCTKVAKSAPKHMRDRSPEWRVLVDNWDELVALLKEEHPNGTAPKCYARMKELFAEARATPVGEQ